MTNERKRKSRDGTESIARKIWLAGLGAYGKRIEDAQEQWSKTGDDTARRFQELVEKGQEIESQSSAVLKAGLQRARGTLSEARERLRDSAEGNVAPVGEMIARVRRRIGLDDKAVQDRIDALTRQVHDLAQTVSRQTAPKKPRKTAGAKKTARAPKTSVQKSARKSPGARAKTTYKARSR